MYGLGPLYVVKADGTTSSFARDGGKSIRAEVNGAGAVSASFRYRAYGAISQSSGASSPSYLGYAGQLVDPSGLLNMRARWYDPATGRFTTHDPAGGNPSSPASLNAFDYANANPVLLSDPSGACPQCIVWYLQAVGSFLIGEFPNAVRASRSSNGWIAATGYVELVGYAGLGAAAGMAGFAAAGAELTAASGVAGQQAVQRFGPGAADAEEELTRNLPSIARVSNDFDWIASRLQRFHGVDVNDARARLHAIKHTFELGGDDDVLFDYTGGVWNSVTREYLGSLTIH